MMGSGGDVVIPNDCPRIEHTLCFFVFSWNKCSLFAVMRGESGLSSEREL